MDKEKAKAYDIALDKIKMLLGTGSSCSREELEYVFPELAESEDKRMIQYFKDLAPFDKAEELYEKYGFSHKDAIAWLEKKCEQKSVKVPKFKVGDFIQFNGMGHTRYTIKEVCGLSHYINTCNKRMDMSYTDANFELVEQKPADKVKPKFKVGDWIIHNKNIELANSLMLVTGKNNNEYLCKDINGQCSYNIEFIDKDYHLWTIQDAKAGDVLVASDGSIFLFGGMVDYACKYYVALTTDNVIKVDNMLEHYWETARAVHPSTKEQRDTLMKAMADAGYTFDFEKKELKKIEQKPVEWSEKDEDTLRCIIDALDSLDIRTNTNGEHEDHTEEIYWLKSLKERVQPKQKQEWSEEDEDNFKHLMDEIVCLGNSRNSANRLHYDRLIKFLHELKNRVQPREEWRDKDERMLDRLIAYFEKRVAFTDDDNPRYANWLKSLRPQSQWRPSGEQMDALETAVSSLQSTALESLYNKLKKL